MNLRLLSIAACACSLAAGAAAEQSLETIGRTLLSLPAYSDSVSYEVLLPNLAEPVEYSLYIQSTSAENDTLAPCRYLIEWNLPGKNGNISNGFSAYFDGTHYRRRDERLQEYHASRMPDVFAPAGNAARGVQQQAQFVDILPQAMGAHFIEMASDSSYIYNVTANTLVGGHRATVVEGVRRLSGFDCAEYKYILDSSTLLPRRIELENNPGQLGEQAITVIYSEAADTTAITINEEYVSTRKASDFEQYRESTFTIESLPGRPLPRIAARTSDGDRYLHERGEAMTAPTILVFLDAAVGSTPEVMTDIRSAINAIPGRTDIIWAFVGERNEEMPAAIPGEISLPNARGAARSCGVGSVTPVMIFVGSNGIVSDFIIGNNQDLTSLVIQKTSIR